MPLRTFSYRIVTAKSRGRGTAERIRLLGSWLHCGRRGETAGWVAETGLEKADGLHLESASRELQRSVV